jgi:hypothetical protein
MAMHLTTTDRGYERIEFTDANGAACSLQQSSAIHSDDPLNTAPGSTMLWLGVNEPVPRVLVPGEGWQPVPQPAGALIAGRMHLDRDAVSDLVTLMEKWLDTGSLQG